MKRLGFTLCILFPFATGCTTIIKNVFLNEQERKEIGPVNLTPEGQKVQLSKNEPEKKCQQLADFSVTARAESSNASSFLNNRFRNKAATLGANYAVMDSLTSNAQNTLATLNGRTYRCPE